MLRGLHQTANIISSDALQQKVFSENPSTATITALIRFSHLKPTRDYVSRKNNSICPFIITSKEQGKLTGGFNLSSEASKLGISPEFLRQKDVEVLQMQTICKYKKISHN